MIVHEPLPLARSRHLSHRPAKARTGERRHNAAVFLESAAKHRRFGDGFRAGVGRRRHLPRRLFPPKRNQAPTHRQQLSLTVLAENNVNRVGRRDVVVRLQIARRPKHDQEFVHFRPRVSLRKLSGDWLPSAVADQPRWCTTVFAPQAAARRSGSRIASSADSSRSIIASVCSGVGVKRSRSSPRGTVG